MKGDEGTMALPNRTILDQEENELRDNILRMSDLTDKAIDRCIQSLRTQNIELARQVIADDQKINDLRYIVEEEAYKVLALQAPAARDMRKVVVAIHIAVELERMADHAAGIAKLCVELAKESPLKPLVDIPRMAEISREMLRDGIAAYMDANTELAAIVVERDNEVDELDKQVYRELLTYMLQDARNINRATYLLWVSHNMERIADRITNICERVLFMVTGNVRQNEED